MPPGAFYCILKANDPEIHYHNTLYLTYVRLHTAYEYTFKMPKMPNVIHVSNLNTIKVLSKMLRGVPKYERMSGWNY